MQAACGDAEEAAAGEPDAAEPDQAASQAAAEGSIAHPHCAVCAAWWQGGPSPLECLAAFRDEVGARPHGVGTLDRVGRPSPLEMPGGFLGRGGRPPSPSGC